MRPAESMAESMPDPAARSFSFDRTFHDRDHVRRDDEDSLAALWADPDTAALVVAPGAVAMSGEGLRLLPAPEAPSGERCYLGTHEGRTYVSVMVEEIGERLTPTGLRQAGAALDPVQAGLLVHAIGLANWHSTHRRCARCGEPTLVIRGGHERRCPACTAAHFPRTDPAVIMLISDDEDRALLGRQASWPEGRFSTLAGFLEPGETLEDAVRREVAEETGVVVGEVRYAASQPWPLPSSLMLGFFGRAQSPHITVDGDEISEARWFTRADLRDLAQDRQVLLPGVISISRWLIETWYGERLPGGW